MATVRQTNPVEQLHKSHQINKGANYQDRPKMANLSNPVAYASPAMEHSEKNPYMPSPNIRNPNGWNYEPYQDRLTSCPMCVRSCGVRTRATSIPSGRSPICTCRARPFASDNATITALGTGPLTVHLTSHVELRTSPKLADRNYMPGGAGPMC